MKGIYLIAIAFLASWTVTTAWEPIFEYDQECPSEPVCPPKLLPNLDNCAKFYECVNGKKEPRDCANGLHFSKKWNGCVDPSKADCEPVREGECKYEGQKISHECQCDKYYECTKNLQKALRGCADGSHFSKEKGECVPGGCTRDFPILQADCENGKYLPHECKCEKYYLCKNNQKVLQECVNGSHFDKTKLTCVEGPCDGICTDNDTLSHECDCDKYYKCINKEWIVQACSANFHFSPTRKTCQPIEEAGCYESKLGDCEKDKPPKWSHECDCRLYYECKNKKKDIQYCAWGFYFDQSKQTCEIAKNVKNCKNNWDDLD